jgi:ABC-type phosphate transport system ATPase subunit
MDNMLFVQKDRAIGPRAPPATWTWSASHLHTAFPRSSGGMQQRVGIARAFSIERTRC